MSMTYPKMLCWFAPRVDARHGIPTTSQTFPARSTPSCATKRSATVSGFPTKTILIPMRLTDEKINRLKGIAAESASNQADMAEGPTLPQSLSEIPDDWLEAERKMLEKVLGHTIPSSVFMLYVTYLTDAFREENERMLRRGQRMD